MSNINIETLRELDGGVVLGFYAKGHHDDLSFTAALAEYLDEIKYPRLECKSSDINRVYWRNVPAPYYDDGAWQMVNAKGPGRGAYAVTVVELH
jgi:hypothetical protein